MDGTQYIKVCDTTAITSSISPTLPVLTEEKEIPFQDDEQTSARPKLLATLQEQSFANSSLQQSEQSFNSTSTIQQSAQSLLHNQSIQHNPQSMVNTESIVNTASLQNTEESQSNTQSHRYVRYGSFDNGNPHRFKKRSWLGKSFRNLRSASLSVSMLAKPSDDRKASSFLAGWNVSNLIQGTTILGIPYAVQQGGWAAVAMIIFIGFLTCHTGKLLIECMYETSKKTGIRRRLRINYPEVAQAVLGRKGLVMMNIIQNSVMFGGVVMYIILLGTIWADILEEEIPQLGLKEWAVINSCFTLPTLFITKMSVVSWFSMVSVFSIMAAFLVMITFCITQIPLLDLANVPSFNGQTFPVSLGIIMFSFCAHAVLPSIEGSMKKPHSYNAVMNTSFTIASLSKAALGILMVLRFGEGTAEVITVNLASNGHFIFSKLTSGLVIANVILAMPLEMFVVSVSYDDAMLRYFAFIDRSSGYHWVWLLISRPLLLTLSLFASVIVPHFGLLMGLIGSLTGSALCFLFPCYCHLKLRWGVLRGWQIAFDISIIVFGIAAGLLGFVYSLKGLINHE